jgi:hypothetical protein
MKLNFFGVCSGLFVVVGLIGPGCGGDSSEENGDGGKSGTSGTAGDAGEAGGGTGGSAGSGGSEAGQGGTAGAGASGGENPGGQPGTGGTTAGGQGGEDAGGAGAGGAGGEMASPSEYALALDGTDDRVSISADATIPTGNSARTVELWVYARPSSWTVDTNTIFDYGTNTLHRSFGIDMDQHPNLQLVTWGDDLIVDSGLPNEGWFHLAATYDGAVARVFVNGAERGTLTVSAPLDTLATAVAIGGSVIIPSYFDGMVDEFRIWNRARTESEIARDMTRRLMGNEAGLVAYLRLEEGSGATSEDATGNGNHGDLVGPSGAQVAGPAWVSAPSWAMP